MEIIFREQADFYSVMRINDLPENFLKKLVVVKPLGEEKPLTVTEEVPQRNETLCQRECYTESTCY